MRTEDGPRVPVSGDTLQLTDWPVPLTVGETIEVPVGDRLYPARVIRVFVLYHGMLYTVRFE